MAVAVLKGIKVVLKLTEGSQTITGCNQSATDDQLYTLGSAVAKLEAHDLEGMSKIEESILMNE